MIRSRMAGALVLAVLATPAGARQQAQAPPTFPRGVELVTVDVVVTDKAGNPVVGLTKDDFTVQDDGQPQPISSFQAIHLPPAAPMAAGGGRVRRPRLSTNIAPIGPPGRSHVIIFDNLHLTPGNAQRAKAAVASFIENGVGEGDRVTLIATGGGPWWSTTMPQGRADLLDLLKGLEARKFPENATDRLTDYESMRIYVTHDTALAGRVQERLDRYGTGKSRQASQQMQEERNNQTLPGVIDPYIENLATQTYLKVRTRMRATLAVLERAVNSLAGLSDRKAVLLVSEGFVFDTSEDGFKDVTEAARRANASLYFLDTKGLEVSPLYSAQFGNPVPERDVMAAIADTAQDGDGAEVLARDTGGFSVRSTNDLSAGVLHIGTDSRNYYLLGFDPPADAPRDGRFRKITVKVRGRGLTVRARKGYYAPRDGAPPPAVHETKDLQLQEALDAPYPAPDIPLRTTAYVVQESTLGKARVLVASEADVSRASFQEAEGGARASLDVLLVVADRHSGEVQRYDQKIDLQRKPQAGAAAPWYSITREFDLAPGSYQAKLVVRDVVSKRLGTVMYDFEVPVLDSWWVSTPVLTDTLQRSAGQGAILPVVLVRRTFAPKGVLYCRFDVSGAQKDKATGLPRVSSGHRLRRVDGTVVSQNEPTAILPTTLGGVTRMIGIPLDGLTPGEYDLMLTIRDELSGKSQELVEPLEISPPAPPG
jgi:VWFA-related protein